MDVEFYEKAKQKLMAHSVSEGRHTCWIWHGTIKTSRGTNYGVIRLKYKDNGRYKWKTFNVSRLSYQVFVSSEFRSSDRCGHICHNTLCINPLHLSMEPQNILNNRKTCKNRDQCSLHGIYAACLLNHSE